MLPVSPLPSPTGVGGPPAASPGRTAEADPPVEEKNKGKKEITSSVHTTLQWCVRDGIGRRHRFDRQYWRYLGCEDIL